MSGVDPLRECRWFAVVFTSTGPPAGSHGEVIALRPCAASFNEGADDVRYVAQIFIFCSFVPKLLVEWRGLTAARFGGRIEGS